MSSEGVDYAWARPDPVELYALGKRFVCRYLAYLPNGKVLTSIERAALHDAGLDIVLNWEQGAGDMLKGREVGREHASAALREAVALGAPSTVPIYFSCDTQIVNAIQMEAVARYLQGAADILGRNRVGVYGQYSVIERFVGGVSCAWGWQTYAWSAGKISPLAHIYQYRNGVNIANADCDLNRAMKPEIGAWTVSLSASEARDFKYLTAREEAFAEMNDTYLDDANQPHTHKGVLALKALLNRPVITDEQIASLAQHLASVSDPIIIRQALKDVLQKGIDNA